MNPAFIDLAEGGDPHGTVMAALHKALRAAARARVAASADTNADADVDADAEGPDLVTVDIHVGFVRPAAGRLALQAEVTGGGRSVCFCLARLLDGEGALVAQAMGTFRTVARA